MTHPLSKAGPDPSGTGAFQFLYKTNCYATHQPVLYEVLRRTAGPVLELGSGKGSTPLIHHFAPGRRIITVDNDQEWLTPLKHLYEDEHHRFIHTADWNETLNSPELQGPWDAVFIDQSPWEARYLSLMKFKDTARFIVIHDCDYFPANKVFGTQKRPILDFIDEGSRDYSDVFKHWKEFFPKKPWVAESGPPTLLGSNLGPCDLDVSYDI